MSFRHFQKVSPLCICPRFGLGKYDSVHSLMAGIFRVATYHSLAVASDVVATCLAAVVEVIGLYHLCAVKVRQNENIEIIINISTKCELYSEMSYFTLIGYESKPIRPLNEMLSITFDTLRI